MKRRLMFLLLSAAVIRPSFVNAQQYEGFQAEKRYPGASLISYSNATGTPSLLILKSGVVNEANFFNETRSLFAMQFSDSWKKVRTDKDEIGMVHHRYQQYYNSIKVEQGEYILHEKNNSIVSANGVFYGGIQLPVTPVVSESNALQTVLASVNAVRYKWEMPEEEALLRHMEKNDRATWFPKAELVITPVLDGSKKPLMALAFKFDIYADEPMSRHYIYVDALTGVILKKENRICEFIATGTATTMYSGTVSFKTDSTGPGAYRLRDISRGGGVETYNLNHGTNYGTAVDFTDSDNIWNTTANQDNAAYDAHYGAQMTYDYYLNVHNRNSYNNLGTVLKSYIHYSNSYNNAFWNGSVMTYGDGNGTTFSPLTTLDVCGHELTHGVTGNSSGLIYSYESGALNESFSDIFGTCVDFYANPGGANFLVGEQCYTPGTPGDALRVMNNPNLAGDPDTYLGTNWYAGTGDNGGVHTNSGVQNFWFYLLCQGGTGTNDIGFNYNVSGIGINSARLIAYRNNAFYLTSGSQYADARTYSIQAAGDLFGPCSAEQLATKNAWDAVGVTGSFNPLPGVTSVNNGPVCPGSVLSLSSSGGSSYSWTGPGGFTSSQQNPQINGISSSQAGTYTVVVSNGQGCTASKSTVVTVYPQPQVTTNNQVLVCPGDSASLTSVGTAFGAGGPPVSTTSTTVFTIPDANQTGISSPITVSNSGTAGQVVSVTIDSLIHPWVGDLNIYLVAPDLSQIALALGVGSSGDNFLHTTFSSTANNIIGTAGNNTAPFTGNYAPQNPFTGLTGSANGQWKLKVVDAYSQDIGTLYGWTITLSGPNAITSYSWSPTTGLSVTVAPNTTSGVAVTTTYYVTVNDYMGCTSSASATVAINPVTLAHTTTDVSCGGSSDGQINLQVAGGNLPFSYLWSDGSSTEDLSALVSGVYTVTVTDAIGCTGTLSASVTEPSLLVLNGVPVNPSCSGVPDGAIGLTISGGTIPYGFVWSDGATTEDRSALGPGTYNVTVTDGNGCVAYNSYIIASPSPVTAGGAATSVSCYGGSDGTINLTPGGGTPPYSFQWSDGNTGQNRSALSTGNYSVTVTDDLGCEAFDSFSVTQPLPLGITTVKTHIDCKNESTGAIQVTVSGGTSPYFFAWSNGATTEDLTGIPKGTYTVIVTDSKGCSLAKVQVLTQPSKVLNVTATKTNIKCYGGQGAKATATATGGTLPYSYLWNTVPVSTGSTVTGLGAGVYTCVATDGKGCSKSVTVTITQPALLVLLTSSTDATTPGGNDGTASASVSGGVAPYTYSWNTVPATTTSSISGLAAGSYTVKITDAKGCTKKATVVINQPAAKANAEASAPGACRLEVYPNPGDGFVHALYEGKTGERVAVYLLDFTGKQVYSNSFTSNAGLNSEQYDFNILPKGIYLLVYQSPVTRKEVKLIID